MAFVEETLISAPLNRLTKGYSLEEFEELRMLNFSNFLGKLKERVNHV